MPPPNITSNAQGRTKHSSAVPEPLPGDRKSTRLNSSHLVISYDVFCLKKHCSWRDGHWARTPAGSRSCPRDQNVSLYDRTAGLHRARDALCFFFNDTAATEIYTLSLHDALPI